METRPLFSQFTPGAEKFSWSFALPQSVAHAFVAHFASFAASHWEFGASSSSNMANRSLIPVVYSKISTRFGVDCACDDRFTVPDR
jgi:hypothetical protein